jgi:hypothetical protein
LSWAGAEVCAFALPAEQAEELDRFGTGGAEPVRYPGVGNADLVAEETREAVAGYRDAYPALSQGAPA